MIILKMKSILSSHCTIKKEKRRKNVAIKGLENTKAFAKEVNGLSFEYGDVVKVYHAESSRLHWYQKDVYVGEGKIKK